MCMHTVCILGSIRKCIGTAKAFVENSMGSKSLVLCKLRLGVE